MAGAGGVDDALWFQHHDCETLSASPEATGDAAAQRSRSRLGRAVHNAVTPAVRATAVVRRLVTLLPHADHGVVTLWGAVHCFAWRAGARQCTLSAVPPEDTWQEPLLIGGTAAAQRVFLGKRA